MKNKQFIPVILFALGAVAAVAGMLMLFVNGIAFKISGGVLIFIGICLVGAGYFLTYKIKPKYDDSKPVVYNDKNLPRPDKPVHNNKNLTVDAGKISEINQDDTVSLNVWGEVRRLKVSTRRIQYAADETGAGTPFNGQELALLNEVIGGNLINGEDVKAAVLKYVNEVTAEWDDGYYEGKITSIAPPEVEINEIIIDNLNEEQPEVLFCGEALCDEEHGIVIAFEDGKFSSIGGYGDFL